MPELSRTERREIFFSLSPLLTSALNALELVLDDDADPAARTEAAETLTLIDAEIERRLDFVGVSAWLDGGCH